MGLIKESYVNFYSDPSEFPTSGNSLNVADGQLQIVSNGIQKKIFSEFTSMAEFEAAGGSLANSGPVWIGGESYNSKFIFDGLPGFVLIGDSTSSLGNDSGTVSLTASGTTVTVTRASHGCVPGSAVFLTNANEAEYNFVGAVNTVIDANSFTMTAPLAPSTTPATGSPVMVNQQRMKDSEWCNISNWMSQGKGLYLGNFSCGGTRTSALNEQLNFALDGTKNLWGISPSIVFISTGINDAINNVSSSVSITNLESAINRVLNFGAIPVVLTTFPYQNTAANWSVARIQEARKYNQWIRDNVVGLGGVVIDANYICLDAANQYGNWKSGYSYDGVHPGKQAAFQVAKNIKTALWDKIISSDKRVLTILSPNESLTGTGGTVTGTGGSGSAANSFTLTSAGGGAQTVVGSKGIGLSGKSESQRIAITAAASLDRGRFTLTGSLNGSVEKGKRYVLRARLRSASLPSAFRYIQSTFNATINGISSSQITGFFGSGTDSWNEEFYILFESAPFVFPIESSVTYFVNELAFAFETAGNATFDISDFGIYKAE